MIWVANVIFEGWRLPSGAFQKIQKQGIIITTKAYNYDLFYTSSRISASVVTVSSTKYQFHSIKLPYMLEFQCQFSDNFLDILLRQPYHAEYWHNQLSNGHELHFRVFMHSQTAFLSVRIRVWPSKFIHSVIKSTRDAEGRQLNRFRPNKFRRWSKNTSLKKSIRPNSMYDKGLLTPCAEFLPLLQAQHTSVSFPAKLSKLLKKSNNK